MKRISDLLKFILLTVFVFAFFLSCKKTGQDVNPDGSVSKPASAYDAVIATAWFDLQMHLISGTPGYESPVAARALAYTGLALYESVCNGMPGYRSLGGQLNGLGNMPRPDSTSEYHWGLVASTAQYTLIRDMYNTTSDVYKKNIDSLRNYFETELKKGISDAVVDRSVRYGAEVATAVWNYAKTDGGLSGNLENYPTGYILPSALGSWKPTGAQAIPLLPYWGNNRTLVASNRNALPDRPLTFSFANGSEFYREAKMVLDSSRVLTQGQKSFADFWNDPQGTVSPAGHHMNLVTQIIKKEKLMLDKAAEVYVKTGITMNDVHIVSWKTKYTYSLMRPVTYIRQALSPSWIPYQSSPPYPEYSSAIAGIAGGNAKILESFFGSSYAFEDDSYYPLLPKRSFASFSQYEREAALAGFYAGRQFYFSGIKGRENGNRIAGNVLALKFTK